MQFVSIKQISLLKKQKSPATTHQVMLNFNHNTLQVEKSFKDYHILFLLINQKIRYYVTKCFIRTPNIRIRRT